ncbi:hypothetical protein CYJ73_21065 [Gordonia terrae]|uniref:Uncharacterized protein n=1 Tax=Gordonia terrae TaxID=2055 RepID=A0A2I1R347_9ACTN|nr:hypothetical protein [Gordonia terrae]PKZ63557.1 hypothetical protein CYJ73_21065 [Gordonia terrae]
MTAPTGDSYPLTFVELSRWNVAQAQPVSCPRHRTPEPMVAGTHESAGHPMWICTECGYATPVLDDEARMTLGATQTFTRAAETAQLRLDTRLYALPTGPATDHTTGTVAVRERTQRSTRDDIVTFVTGYAIFILGGWIISSLFPATGLLARVVITVTVAATVAGLISYRLRLRRERRGVLTNAARVVQAGHVLAGDWIVKPAPSVGGHPWPWPTTESAAAAITHHRAARVVQVARLGVTAQIQVTTTAGNLVLPDLAPVGVVEMADPALADFTYHPRG